MLCSSFQFRAVGEENRNTKRVFVSESELIKLSETLPHPDNFPVCVLHNVFVKGDQTNYELGEEELEVSTLYPDYKYTPIEEFLEASVSAPRDIKLTYILCLKQVWEMYTGIIARNNILSVIKKQELNRDLRNHRYVGSSRP
ncbi:hypothetical protein SUGI_0705500 [Cryptomeria japonica]|nr:hypothetical protein SUGI_0705500 [Cryptomeria japonica]